MSGLPMPSGFRPAAEQTIPPLVLDAMTACRAVVDVRDREKAMRWLTYQGHREAARWVMTHPADYGRVLDSLTYWARLKEIA